MTIENNTTNRSIDELLSLGTYQGMTDAEIDMLIEYRVNKTVGEREYAMISNAQIMAANAQVEASRALAEDANSVLKSLVRHQLPQIVLEG